jgi:hypothetical protein
VFGHFIVYWCSTVTTVDSIDRSCAVARNAGVVLLSNHGNSAFTYQETCPVIKNTFSNLIILDKLRKQKLMN